jgi:two-component system, response regulator
VSGRRGRGCDFLFYASLELNIKMENKVDILLVDDSSSDLEVVTRSLRKAGITNAMVHFDNGEEAQDYIFCTGRYSERSIGQKPRLIILDLKIPKISGLELLKQIKSDERTRIIPVVILTSSIEDKDLRKAYEYGANSYLVKAADYLEFSQLIMEMGKYWLLSNQVSG